MDNQPVYPRCLYTADDKDAPSLLVTLDGVELDSCFRASEDEGWAEVYARLPDGSLEVRDGEIPAWRLIGNVRVERKGD